MGEKVEMNPHIEVIVFDAYGTLFNVHSVAAFCNRKFPGWGAVLSMLWRGKQLEYAWLRSLMGSYEDFWKVTEAALMFACRSLALSCSTETRKELMECYLRLDVFPDVAPALQSLSEYRLAILSNGSLPMLTAAVENAGLKSLFADVISVDEAQTYKPSPRAYGLLTRRLSVSADKIGFISSNFWDIAGAKNFGFRTSWVNRNSLPEDELGFRPDCTQDALPAAVAVLS
jgi:2-haloacid dehalogenase